MCVHIFKHNRYTIPKSLSSLRDQVVSPPHPPSVYKTTWFMEPCLFEGSFQMPGGEGGLSHAPSFQTRLALGKLVVKGGRGPGLLLLLVFTFFALGRLLCHCGSVTPGALLDSRCVESSRALHSRGAGSGWFPCGSGLGVGFGGFATGILSSHLGWGTSSNLCWGMPGWVKVVLPIDLVGGMRRKEAICPVGSMRRK